MLALAIFIVTVALVVWQPRGLGIGWSAMTGAAADLALGVVHWRNIPVVWHIVWNATFTFVALIIISLLLDEAGFFRWAALHVARWGHGRGQLLLPLVVLLGSAIAAFFANDGAALLLTPIVMGILTSLEFPPEAALAFIIATGFVADTTSLPLVISNLVNIVSANYFDIGFTRYALVMVPVNAISLVATLIVLTWAFRRHANRVYAVNALEVASSAIHDQQVFRFAWPVLALLLGAYFVTAPLGVPVSFVTIAGALILLMVAARWPFGAPQSRVIDVHRVLRGAPWQIVFFSLGMYLVVYGLRNAGLTGEVAAILRLFAVHGLWAAAFGTGFLAALLSSVMNNLPSVLIGALAISHVTHVPASVHETMVYANVIGCDLGPKFTPIGSLATLLWLHVLARKGVRITWRQYMRIGLIITPPVLIATLAVLAFWLPVSTSALLGDEPQPIHAGEVLVTWWQHDTHGKQITLRLDDGPDRRTIIPFHDVVAGRDSGEMLASAFHRIDDDEAIEPPRRKRFADMGAAQQSNILSSADPKFQEWAIRITREIGVRPAAGEDPSETAARRYESDAEQRVTSRTGFSRERRDGAMRSWAELLNMYRNGQDT